MASPMNDLKNLLSGPTLEAAPGLLGWVLERQLPAGVIRGRIIETEAYLETDEASHSFRGQTARNRSMFGPAGHAYVYFTYGMHFCLNVVTGRPGTGEAVLIRSLQIFEGEELALANRNDRRPLADGPGKLCQALNIGRDLDGHDLGAMPLILRPGPVFPEERMNAGVRIGIRHAQERPYRFWLTGP